MIDPLHTLAFSMQANPGIYALLLGSGVSRSAKIPTGWDITLELVRKLAQLNQEDCGSDPAKWHFEKYGSEPDYSKLLDAVAKTPAERQQLLQSYFEATEQEREEGLKEPTPAHNAIAELVAGGFVKMIITTNFDRLIERALEKRGITPTVISSPDQIVGALPLTHIKCGIVKVHGDYMDTRILNTTSELASYPKALDAYLDRIFDEFGLIVCGWSAEWDEALRNAIIRSHCRRFTTYWAARGCVGDHAARIVAHRSAQKVPIKDSDTFFFELSSLVESLEKFSRPHPLSIAAAVTSLKRYLTEHKFRIQLADLIKDETDRVLSALSQPTCANQQLQITPESFVARTKSYENACTTLTALASVGGYWSEEQHYQIWRNALARLTTLPITQGNSIWCDFSRYPATLFLYSIGITAIEAGRLNLIGNLLSTPIRDPHNQEQPVVRLLHPLLLIEDERKAMDLLGTEGRRHCQLSHWLQSKTRGITHDEIPDDRTYEFAFDEFEILLSLSFAAYGNWGTDWIPVGVFLFRRENRELILNKIEDSISSMGNRSPYVESRILGKTVEACTSSVSKLRARVTELKRFHMV